jgi:8-oxo-dGTP pyrophosphatase MutT (NUDIX family)
MSDARAAATVLLVRDGEGGALEVFLVQRHRRSGFLPNAWVFPGGRVDEADRTLAGDARVRGGAALARGFGLARPAAAAHGVAAARETFEETGVWLGDGALADDLRLEVHSGRTDLGALLDAAGGGIDLDPLHPWSWWVTPTAEPRRFDTRFVLAHAPSAIGRHDEIETVASRWISPHAALEAGQDSLALAPPTWWTLRELARHPTVASAVAAPRHADVPIQPVMTFSDSGLNLVLPGHPDHDRPVIPGVPDRITWERDRWVAWRGGEVVTGR